MVDPRNGDIYVPTRNGIRKSVDGGATWTTIGSSGASGGAGTAGFGTIQIDSLGNLYQVSTQLGSGINLAVSKDGGATWTKNLITVPGLQSYIFGWPVVGDPGRLAIAFYGTPTPNNPSALYRTYVAMTTNALDEVPAFTTALADDHVMKVGTVCLQGTACALSATSVNGDRSLADFFMIDKDPRDGRLLIVYNDDGDQSPVTQKGQSYVAVIRQRTGPSLFADPGEVAPPTKGDVAIRSASSQWGSTLAVSGTHGLPPGNYATDGANDAIAHWTLDGPNIPAMDLREVSVSEANGALNFSLKVSDLSDAAKVQAAQAAGAPSWVVTWWEQARNANGSLGLQAHYFLKWLGGNQFVYGKTVPVDMPQLGAPAPKQVSYPPAGSATGSISGNVINVSVPLSAVGNLRAGDKIDNVTGWTWAERGQFPGVIDQVKPFSYRIGTSAAAQHQVDGYVQISIDDPTFSQPYLASLHPNDVWSAQIPSSLGPHTIYVRQVLSSALYNPEWADLVAGPVATYEVVL